MKKTGLTDHVISAVGLDNGMAKGKYTPAGSVPLVNNDNGVLYSGSFNCSSVIGMLLCLSGNTRPKIDFAVNFCERFMSFPNHFNEEALKQINLYLKLNRDRGLILNPNRELFNIDSYPDAYFSVIYGHENLTDTTCVKSLSVYAIKFSDCPILWQYNIQT